MYACYACGETKRHLPDGCWHLNTFRIYFHLYGSLPCNSIFIPSLMAVTLPSYRSYLSDGGHLVTLVEGAPLLPALDVVQVLLPEGG